MAAVKCKLAGAGFKAAFTLQVMMTNSDCVTISNFLDDMLTFLLKVTHIRCVHYTALGETSQKKHI